MELSYVSGKPAKLWETGIQRVYLLFGEEDRLKEEAMHAFRQHLIDPDFADFDSESLDVGQTTSENILASAAQAPFGSTTRMLIVSGLERWREKGKASEIDTLIDGIGKIPNSTCLILVASAQEGDEKRKTAVGVKFDNAVKKRGAIVQFRALKGEPLIAWMKSRVSLDGKSIDSAACNALVQAVGSELLLLEQELQKLVNYSGDRLNISTLDVAKNTMSTPEDVVFATIDAVTRRETDKALTLLNELHQHDPKPQAVAGRLLALLARQYRLLWQAKLLKDRRISPRDVRNLAQHLLDELPIDSNIVSQGFRAGELFTQSNSYTWDVLHEAINLILRCDIANKGDTTDEAGIFGSDVQQNLQLLVFQLSQ